MDFKFALSTGPWDAVMTKKNPGRYYTFAPPPPPCFSWDYLISLITLSCCLFSAFLILIMDKLLWQLDARSWKRWINKSLVISPGIQKLSPCWWGPLMALNLTWAGYHITSTRFVVTPVLGSTKFWVLVDMVKPSVYQTIIWGPDISPADCWMIGSNGVVKCNSAKFCSL